jgi:hypothetical protein
MEEGFNATDSDRVKFIAEEAKLSQTGFTRESDLASLGKAYNIDAFIIGRISQIDVNESEFSATVKMLIKVFDVRSGTYFMSERLEGYGVDQKNQEKEAKLLEGQKRKEIQSAIDTELAQLREIFKHPHTVSLGVLSGWGLNPYQPKGHFLGVTPANLEVQLKWKVCDQEEEVRDFDRTKNRWVEYKKCVRDHEVTDVRAISFKDISSLGVNQVEIDGFLVVWFTGLFEEGTKLALINSLEKLRKLSTTLD